MKLSDTSSDKNFMDNQYDFQTNKKRIKEYRNRFDLDVVLLEVKKSITCLKNKIKTTRKECVAPRNVRRIYKKAKE